MTTAATTMIVENKAEEKYAGVKTSVWWDIENCAVPRGWDAHAIANNVSSALMKMDYGGPVSISAYGDTNLIPRDVQQALSSTGVRLNHVPAGVKDASDKKILVDMCLWAADNPAPANFMLISGDRDFSYALHQLRMRTYNILLAQPSHASAPLVTAAKSVWLWTSLASGGLPLSSVEPSRLFNNGRSHVSNVDMVKHPVSEHAQFSKPTDSTSDAGDTKDLITRENQVPGRLPQETRQNMPQSGRGHTGEFFNAQTRQNMPQSDREAADEFVNAQTLQNMPQSGRGHTCEFLNAQTRQNMLQNDREAAYEFVNAQTRQTMPQSGRGATCELVNAQTLQNMPQCGRGQTGEFLNAQTRQNMPQGDREAADEFVDAQSRQTMPQSGRGATCEFVNAQTLQNMPHSGRGTASEFVIAQTLQNMPQSGRVATGEFVYAQTRQNMPQSGRGATCEFVNAHLLDKRHIARAAFLASQIAQSSVSAKPIQVTELVEPVLCQVCQISCINKESYEKHKRSKRHRKNMVGGTDARDKLCYNCREQGHFVKQCPRLVQFSGKRESEGYTPPGKRPAIMPCVYSMAEESTDPSTFYPITGSETREGSRGD